jgi:hypothetical protein
MRRGKGGGSLRIAFGAAALLFAGGAASCGSDGGSLRECAAVRLLEVDLAAQCVAEAWDCPESCPELCVMPPREPRKGVARVCVIDAMGSLFVTMVGDGAELVSSSVRHSEYWGRPSTLTADEEPVCLRAIEIASSVQNGQPNCPP